MSKRVAAVEPPESGECRVAAQATFAGTQNHTVMAVAGQAANGRPHIAMRVGKVLVYFNDRESIDSFGLAFSRAWELAERLFPKTQDSFDELDERARRLFEKTRDPAHLRA